MTTAAPILPHRAAADTAVGNSPKDRARPRADRAGRLGYLPALDGVRALAALAVMVYHSYNNDLMGGWAGVDVFFVLSGFLITALLLAEFTESRTISLARFYWRRACRLFPAVILLLGFCVLVDRHFGGVVATQAHEGIVATLTYTTNVRMAGEHPVGFLYANWTLALEEQFYFLWPIILYGILRWKGRTPALVIALSGAAISACLRLLLAAHVSSAFDTFAPPLRLDGLLLGCALALAQSLGYIRRIPAVVLRTAGAMGTVGLAYVFVKVAYPDGAAHLPFRVGVASLVVSCGSAALIANIAVRPFRPLTALLSVPPLVQLGQISYGMYLWHAPLLEYGGLVHHFTPDERLLVGIGGGIIAATMSYFWVERHCLRWKYLRFPRVTRRATPASPMFLDALLDGSTRLPKPTPTDSHR